MTLQKPIKNSLPLPFVFTFLLVLILLVIKFAIHTPKPESPGTIPQQQVPFDFGNKKIILDDKQLIFVNGKYQSADPANTDTAIIQNQTITPSKIRASAILVYETQGSGESYYLIGGMNSKNAEIYSTPVLIGDRVQINSLKVDEPTPSNNGIITVEYLDHGNNTPMANPPTVKTTKKFAFEDSGNLIEILH